MQTYHILLIEDDLSIVENLTAYLTAESFSVARLPDRIRRSLFLRRFTRISFSLILHLLREMDTALAPP